MRGAQIADQADSVWQQVAGEVVPAWQKPQALPAQNEPPPYLDLAFAESLLTLPLEVGAQVAGVPLSTLTGMLPAARNEAVLLYADGSTGPAPLNNEPFYGSASATAARGTAVRAFPKELATAVADGTVPLSNSTLFNFEAYVRWRVLQSVLSNPELAPLERRRIKQAFDERLGAAMLQGPLRDAALPKAPSRAVGGSSNAASGDRAGRSLQVAIEGCGTILTLMKERGLFSASTLQLSLGSGTDLFDEVSRKRIRASRIASPRLLSRLLLWMLTTDVCTHVPMMSAGGLAGGRVNLVAVCHRWLCHRRWLAARTRSHCGHWVGRRIISWPASHGTALRVPQPPARGPRAHRRVLFG